MFYLFTEILFLACKSCNQKFFLRIDASAKEKKAKNIFQRNTKCATSKQNTKFGERTSDYFSLSVEYDHSGKILETTVYKDLTARLLTLCPGTLSIKISNV